MSKTAVLESRFVEMIATEVGCRPHQVQAASELFAEGATVPFVARYRKEVTGGLEDLQLETLFKRREYFLELAERRDAILESIREQGKLTDELEAAIRASDSKQELEDLYLPYKPKRR
ncbi:MAG TPA: Tex-like N-terminal domain-containing protein, partial [Thermoanaerobaculia bacterium]